MTVTRNLNPLDVTDAAISKPTRFVWPKIIPPLNAEQLLISDDFVRHWHDVLPTRYGAIERFNHRYPLKVLPDQARFKTLEIGAGIGAHLAFEDLSRQDYHCIELRENMAEAIEKRFPSVSATVGDCQEELPYDSQSFDRVVVVHVLEHLPNLPGCVQEVRRVLKPGGLFSVVLPCDPGLAYGLARKLSAERIFRKRYKQSYKWFIDREHINSPAEILSLLDDGFDELDRAYWPMRVPVSNINLCIGTTRRKRQ
jgi:SAM-dependent methyltransferase